MTEFNQARQRTGSPPCTPARLNFTAAEHAMFAEMLLMDPGVRWYRAVADRIAAAAVHAQLAQVLMLGHEIADARYDVELLSHEWAHALVVRSPVDRVDAELAELTKNDDERGR